MAQRQGEASDHLKVIEKMFLSSLICGRLRWQAAEARQEKGLG